MRLTGARPDDSDEWITIPSHTKCPRSFRLHLHECSNQGINPYQYLQQQNYKSLKNFILPNGESIQASFESIATLTSFFSTNTSQNDTHTFLKHKIPTNGHNTYVKSNKIDTSLAPTQNNLNNIPPKMLTQKNKSFIVTRSSQTGITSCKNHPKFHRNMKFTEPIRSIIATSNYKHSSHDKVLTLYKHILKLNLSPFKLVREADSLSHDTILSRSRISNTKDFTLTFH